MSKYFWLCKSNKKNYSDVQKKRLSNHFHCRPMAVNIIFLTLVIILAAAYLIQVNQTATSGFVVKDMNREISELRVINEKLGLEAAELQSLKYINDATERLRLIAQSKPEYIQTGGGPVALEK